MHGQLILVIFIIQNKKWGETLPLNAVESRFIIEQISIRPNEIFIRA